MNSGPMDKRYQVPDFVVKADQDRLHQEAAIDALFDAIAIAIASIPGTHENRRSPALLLRDVEVAVESLQNGLDVRISNRVELLWKRLLARINLHEDQGLR